MICPCFSRELLFENCDVVCSAAVHKHKELSCWFFMDGDGAGWVKGQEERGAETEIEILGQWWVQMHPRTGIASYSASTEAEARELK